MALTNTRNADTATASQAILQGLAPGGGLFVPRAFPQISMEAVARMGAQPYQERACAVLGSLLDDYTPAEIRAAVDAAYGRFDVPSVAPVHALDPHTHVLELFHGPTLAFKDMALQLLPHLTRLAMGKNGETHELLVLVATSGDTGKAALEGFADVPGTRCAVFYPSEGVSEAQHLQMATQTGNNTHVFAIHGNFDDAQTGVKRLFADPTFAQDMAAKGRVLSSANSINFGRLAPQVAYYFSAYADLLSKGVIRSGEPINFAVPTGNFGNILAAEYARRMGLPIGKLLCASNSNNVLTDFLQTGVYDTRRRFHQTISPSMDILISSNLERLLFELCDRDTAQLTRWMLALQTDKHYDIGAASLERLQAHFIGTWADDDVTRETIRHIWERYGYLMDPHTAVAGHALWAYRERTGDQTPTVIVSTASPFKFGRDVARALLGDGAIQGRDDFACCHLLSDACSVPVPPQIEALPRLPIRHDTIIDAVQMADTLRALPLH